ncbi:MAG: PepSY domain-containing protein [Hymenobacteraceae bacterium]|nr:PepSY domain-containing protein [Hymenobacteraceae bacterium]
MRAKTKHTFSIHHWCGLIAGVFLLVISLTGSILVFHHDIDHALYAELSTLSKPANAVHIDRSFEQVRQAHPNSEIRVPELAVSPAQALRYEVREGKTRKWYFMHPETGAQLGTVDRADQQLVHVLLELHYQLLSGTVGKILVLLCGLALLTLTVTGFILYRKSILKVLTFRQKLQLKTRRSLYSSLHRVVGVWGLVFNLFICITGTWISYGIVQHALTDAGAPVSTPPASVSVDAVLAQVKAAHPDFEIHFLRFPKSAEGKLSVLGRMKTDPSYYSVFYSGLQADLQTGELGTLNMLREQPFGTRLITLLTPLHFGDFAGYFIKILYCIGGLMPGILSISGFVIWYYRQKPQAQPEKKKKVILSKR